MSRAFLVILDSFGVGGGPDAARFGDAGADTLGHIAEACARGAGDRDGLRQGPLRLPTLGSLGLGLAAELATGRIPPGLRTDTPPLGQWGIAVERSAGKDTPSGHWELTGVPVLEPWGTFPETVPAFPADLTAALIRDARLPGLLGDRHASGTVILDELGEEHLRTGKPIVYTSADSVLQIAAHEQVFGLERLYETCSVARRLVDPLRICRVIARPFLGDATGRFVRTGNRKDYAVPPPAPTLLDVATQAGREVRSIGKIADIFARRGTGTVVKAAGFSAQMAALLEAAGSLAPGGLGIVNFVDFDTLYGHRRDVPGYAAALEDLDLELPRLMARLKPGDLVVLTADHGCDPTWPGTDHTRECVPVLALGPELVPRPIGRRESFADVGQTLAHHLGIGPLGAGEAW